MKAVKVSLVASALCVALGAEALGQGRPRARHVIRRIDVTRHVLTHGRVITIRPKGILTPENPRGQRVNGITTNVPWGRRPPPNTRLTILDVIAAQRDPFRVALDLAPDGVNPRVRNRPSPLVLAGAIVPSGFTLAVADLTNPQNRAVTVYWKALVPRFGNGNFYATVPIPAAGIRRGQELYTDKHLAAYTANSIIYEAPAIAFPIRHAQTEGGTTQIGARARGGRILQWRWHEVGWADPMELRLLEHKQEKLPPRLGGRTRIWIRTNLPIGPAELTGSTLMPNTKELINILRSFEPIPTRALRVCAETNSGTLIFEVFGPNTSLFFVDVPIDPRKASVRPDTSVTITAVASSWGFVGQVPPPGPFSTPLPIPPQRLALDTFHSWGCTLGDTIKVAVKTDAELAGRTVHGSIYVRETAGDRIIGTVSFTVGRRKVSGSFSVTNNKHKGGTYTANGSFKRDYKATGPDVDALPGNIGNIGEVKGEYEASWQPGPNSREQAWREPGDCKFKALKFLKKYAGSITLIGPEGDTFLWREKGHSDWK